MPDITPLPTNPEGLTADWITAALRAGGSLPNGRVVAVDSEVIGAGVGFIGTVARLKLSYEGAPAGAPATIIAKIPSEDPGSRMVGVAFGLYEREVRFYSDLAGDCGMPAPMPYFSYYDAAAGQSVILLEDLAAGRFGDQLQEATQAQAELAIDAIGKFHARWWESPDLGEYPWVTSAVEALAQPIQLMYEASWRGFLERFGHLLPAEVAAVVPDFGRRVMLALDQMTVGPETLCQGDFRPDNLFYGNPGSGRPLVVCDWQGPGRASGIVDAAYYIAGSFEPPKRRALEDELLRRYHNQLLEGGVKGYSLEQLRLDYRGYFGAVIAGGVVLGSSLPDGNERGKQLLETIMNRFITAMLDHDSLALLPE